MNRREFIKLSGMFGAGAAGAGLLSGCSTLFPGPDAYPAPGSGKLTATPTFCDMCFWKCAGFVHQENGQP